MIDTAASWAVFYGIEDQNAGLTSVDLKLNYLAPAMSGKLMAKGRLIKMGNTISYAEAHVTDASGKILADSLGALSLTLAGRYAKVSDRAGPRHRKTNQRYRLFKILKTPFGTVITSAIWRARG